VCGHYNPADATVCGACAFVLSNLSPEEKVDAILEDLLDLSKAPMAEAKQAPPPAPEEPEVDEVAAEELFDSLLVEIQPSPSEEPTEHRSVPETVDETPPARELPVPAPAGGARRTHCRAQSARSRECVRRASPAEPFAMSLSYGRALDRPNR